MPTNFQSAITKYISLHASIESVQKPPLVDKKPKTLTSTLPASVSETVDRSPTHCPTKSKRKERKKEKLLPNCAFCSKKHYSGLCPLVVTYSARKAALKDRCVLCLSSEHKWPTCSCTYTCGLCKKKNDHTRAICPMAFEKDKLKKLLTSSSAVPELPMVSTKPNTGTCTLNFSARTGGAHTTLMCSILSPVSNHMYLVRALLDNGCNNTYVSEDFARRAGLMIHSTTMLLINVFLHNNPIHTKCRQTIASLSNSTEFQQTIHIDTLPSIPQDCVVFKCKRFSAQLFCQPDDSQLPSFRLDTTSLPFQNVGIDSCGPLIVNNVKTWIIIFVDLVCHTINLEFLSDMTTNKLLHTFITFLLAAACLHSLSVTTLNNSNC